MNTYTMTINAECPHGAKDCYKAIFQSSRMIPCELIETAVKLVAMSPTYQETMTETLSNWLSCKVVTTGAHGNVMATCERGSP